MKDELFEELKVKIVNKNIEIALYNARLEAAKMLESDSKVQKYLKLCGVKTVVPKFKEKCDSYYEFASFINKMGFSEKETNGVYVYCGSFIEGPVYDIYGIETARNYAVEVSYDNPEVTYRTYWNIEQPSFIRVPAYSCEQFENEHKIITLPIKDARKEFFDLSIEKGQKEAVKELCKKYRMK